jgi:hypothetical protein
MSTSKRPGMAINEDLIEQHVRETRQQAERSNYPKRSTPIHAKAEPVSSGREKPSGTDPQKPDSTS